MIVGGVNVRFALVSPRTNVSKTGAAGGPTGVTELELPDGLEVPAAFVAVTVKE